MHESVVQLRRPGVCVIASASTWIEGEALRQLDDVAGLPGMRACVGMPDLHPGKGTPIGAAFLSEGILYPTLIGSDIGCGMGLWSTDLSARKVRPERLAERLEGLDEPWEGNVSAFLQEQLIVPTAFDGSLGTPGHGNHFVEIQTVARLSDPQRCTTLGLDADHVLVLVHSGSRGLGESILWRHAEAHGAGGLVVGFPEADAYLASHDHALRWAEANRRLCAERLLAAVGADGIRLLDVCHNSVTSRITANGPAWLHRKGAAPADAGPVVIPGSRSDFSFLVEPDPSREDALWSVAHGAGRKMARGEARAKLKQRYRRDDLCRNRFGGRVVCGDEQLLWEEAPDCYKDVGSVIADLELAGLVRVIAVLSPIVTFKTSLGQPNRGLRPTTGDWLVSDN